MDFIGFLTALLATLGALLQEWPTLVVTVALIPVLVNVGKKLGIILDGTAGAWVFGINAALFALYAGLVIAGVDLAGVEQLVGALAVILGALLGVLGKAIGTGLVYPVTKKLPGALGYSHPKG